VTGRGTAIVIVDSFGSPTIRNDLKAFDKASGLPAPPAFTIIQPAGRVLPYDPGNSDMVGWAASPPGPATTSPPGWARWTPGTSSASLRPRSATKGLFVPNGPWCEPW
jgi:hypothetical protein